MARQVAEQRCPKVRQGSSAGDRDAVANSVARVQDDSVALQQPARDRGLKAGSSRYGHHPLSGDALRTHKDIPLVALADRAPVGTLRLRIVHDDASIDAAAVSEGAPVCLRAG